nr:hypothetical protein [Sicyoidochytrium minutum DNA virus]
MKSRRWSLCRFGPHQSADTKMKARIQNPPLLRLGRKLLYQFHDRHLFFKFKASRRVWERFVNTFVRRIKRHVLNGDDVTHEIYLWIVLFLEESDRTNGNMNILLDILATETAGEKFCIECANPSRHRLHATTQARGYIRGILCNPCLNYSLGLYRHTPEEFVTKERVTKLYRCLFKSGQFRVKDYKRILERSCDRQCHTYLLHRSMAYTVLPPEFRDAFESGTTSQICRLLANADKLRHTECLVPMIDGGFFDNVRERYELLATFANMVGTDNTGFIRQRFVVWAALYERFGLKLFEEEEITFYFEQRRLHTEVYFDDRKGDKCILYSDQINKVVEWVLRHESAAFDYYGNRDDGEPEYKEHALITRCIKRRVLARMCSDVGRVRILCQEQSIPDGPERLIRSFLQVFRMRDNRVSYGTWPHRSVYLFDILD